jgi:hypothetical protein
MSLSVLVVASPAGAATNQQDTDNASSGQYSGCPGFSAQGTQGTSSTSDPSTAWGWSGNASPGSDSPPPDTDSESGGCPELVTDATPTAVTTGHDVTDTASFQVDPQGQVAFFLCPASATNCVSQGIYEGVESLAPDASGGSSTALTYTPTAPGNYCFFAVFHNADGTVPESTDDSTECFTVMQTASGAPPTASASSPQSQDADGAALAAPASAPAMAAAAGSGASEPIPGATTVHTGEPWAGALPLAVGFGGLGLLLTGLGARRRRRAADG